ncbi:MAG: hypothetical protein DWB42_19230 [Chloroflexi bacterium]|nr:hypothetical protein [Chloroflexota bacterium]MDL1885727.1 hypothetical protein [Anaerolineae bacterium CFX8]
MPIPDFQTLMLPVLQIAGDGQPHSTGEVIEIIASHFGLSDEDRKELLPSGGQFRLDNRIHWSLTYLKQAGLLESAGRGRFCITQRGIDALRSGPSRIDRQFLEQFPEYLSQ